LQQIAANCCFTPSKYDSWLRDMFVAGLKSDEMLLKFYEQTDIFLVSHLIGY
jgi:hypothetical protein